MPDCFVVGCGFTGSIIARRFAEQGKKVHILERRAHIAGNAFDFVNDDGILVQEYGPHIFHTNNKRVMDFLKIYGEWEDFFLECMVYMDGKYTPSPFNFKTVDDYFSPEKARQIKDHISLVYGNSEQSTIVEMLESEDSVIKEYAEFLFEKDYSLYTAKQWGISPNDIDVSVLKRVPVLFSYKTGYFHDKFQCMPKGGFANVIKSIIDHPNITVSLNTDASKVLSFDTSSGTVYYDGKVFDKPVFYTGALDELFGYTYGRLPYRSLKFEWKTLDNDNYQEAPVVAYPQAQGYTRITEYNKLPVQKSNGKTTIAVEYPLSVNEKANVEPYYPIPTTCNNEIYTKYLNIASKFKSLYVCGRLAEYKYYNMDQAIENALVLCDRFL